MNENKPLIELNIWVVYGTDTIDYPGLYVVRLFEDNKPTDNFFTHEDLEVVRAWIHDEAKSLGDDFNLYRFDRVRIDDKVILEIWL